MVLWKRIAWRPWTPALALVLAACSDGENPACSVRDNRDGTATILCRDGTNATLGSSPERRHVILFMADGMGLPHQIAASQQRTGTDAGLSWQGFPYQNFVTTWDVTTYDQYAWVGNEDPYRPEAVKAKRGYDTERGGQEPSPRGSPQDPGYFFTVTARYPAVFADADVPATDSAAAASALATGQKTERGNLAWAAGDPKQGRLESIGEWLRGTRDGSFGVVSTEPFHHATPGAFCAHSTDRYDTGPIAEQIIRETRPEVVIGAGLETLAGTPELRTALTALRDAGEYVLAERSAEADGNTELGAKAALAVREGRKLFGLFGGPENRWETPKPQNSPGEPTLVRDSYDPTLAVAAEAALDVLAMDPQGFFLMVEGGDIDHCNDGADFRCMIGAVDRFDAAVRAVVDYVDRSSPLSWSDTLLLVTADHANGYLRLSPDRALGKGALPEGADALHDFIEYGRGGHTNELVTLATRGAGAELSTLPTWYGAARILDNTQIYHLMRAAFESGHAHHVILMIGDGMQPSDEVATSRYLHGIDHGLRWHGDDFDHAYVATWDINTYNRYAYADRVNPYRQDGFDWLLGYRPDRGGTEPEIEGVVGGSRSEYFLSSLKGYVVNHEIATPGTDAYAAATALATGHKTDVGHVSWQPAVSGDEAWATLAQQLRREKRGAFGVVTSAPLGASPAAAFVSHASSAEHPDQLVNEMVFQTRPDVIVGGGHPAFAGGHAYLTDASELELQRSPHWQLVERRAGVPGGRALLDAAATAGPRLFGLFGGNDGWLDASGEDPTLAEATQAALTRLSTNGNGFLLVVSQPEVDRASRQGDLQGVASAIGNLDDAVRAAVDFVNRSGDQVNWENTLVLVTATGATGGLSLESTAERGGLPVVTWKAGGSTNELVTVSAMGAAIDANYPGPFGLYQGETYPGLPLLDNTELFAVMRDFLGVDGS